MKQFDFIVSNPPYQKNAVGNNKNTLLPIYPEFMDVASIISKFYSFITPARWLFDTGRTSKDWNNKMLNDPCINVYWYPEDTNTFNNTQIRGGVVITARNTNKSNNGLNGIFIRNQELKTILEKVKKIEIKNSYINNNYINSEFYSISDIIKRSYKTIKNIPDLDTNIFIKNPELFKDSLTKNDNINNYYKILGLLNLKRIVRFIKKEYIEKSSYINNYNVLYPKASGSGKFGESLAPFSIGHPKEIATHTFLIIGEFKTMKESINCVKYLNTRFARSLLSILKPTHQNNINTWRLIPVQNFDKNSDINWNENIENIDKQLYKKYNLDNNEINFLETINYKNKQGYELI